MKRTSGFTLIELLVVLAIVGLLAMVAYPSYQDSIRNTRRADGIAAALALQVAQEKFRANCPYYAANIGAANVCGANAGASTVEAASSSAEGYYSLAIQSASGNSYTIVLDPQGAQAADSACDPMTLAHTTVNPNGLKSPADCWE